MNNITEIELSKQLIRIASYSGYNAEVINLIRGYLENIGFKCDIIDFDGDNSYKVNNLHAIYNPNNSDKILYFAGHTDIVHEGDANLWQFKPFEAEINDNRLYGRGASDMKCAIACFMTAVKDFINQNNNIKYGIGFLITNDEESDSVNGTKKMLKWMNDNNYKITSCIVGEPTNPKKFGEMMKVGRRGSVSFKLTITGKQGHVAYPDIALNPNTIMVNILRILNDHKFDDGTEFFDATNLEVTAIESQNIGGNVIPNHVSANFNVRFNDKHHSNDIIELVKYVCEKSMIKNDNIASKYDLEYRVSGESFICNPKKIANIAQEVINDNINIKAEFSTTGGTSDARFIKDYCNDMIELGLINETAHKIDENSKIHEIEQLKNVYLEILKKY
jgi:succinyl-diaminopimelate desuccinylase|tara:strand:- start:243 stop:1412 length:1170 start_codon:yes stop_codon:yes gene_type:complete